MTLTKLIFYTNCSHITQTFDALNRTCIHFTFCFVHVVKFCQLCQMFARNLTPTNTNLVHKLYTWPCFLILYTELSLKWLFHFYCDSFRSVRAFCRLSFHLRLILFLHLVLDLSPQLLNFCLQINKLVVKVFRVLIKEPV
jgi:hypothetical protein